VSRYGIVGFLDAQRAEREALIDMAVREAMRYWGISSWNLHCQCEFCAGPIIRRVRHHWSETLILSRAEENTGGLG
jgi:hypothetical protein